MFAVNVCSLMGQTAFCLLFDILSPFLPWTFLAVELLRPPWLYIVWSNEYHLGIHCDRVISVFLRLAFFFFF